MRMLPLLLLPPLLLAAVAVACCRHCTFLLLFAAVAAACCRRLLLLTGAASAACGCCCLLLGHANSLGADVRWPQAQHPSRQAAVCVSLCRLEGPLRLKSEGSLVFAFGAECVHADLVDSLKMLSLQTRLLVGRVRFWGVTAPSLSLEAAAVAAAAISLHVPIHGVCTGLL